MSLDVTEALPKFVRHLRSAVPVRAAMGIAAGALAAALPSATSAAQSVCHIAPEASAILRCRDGVTIGPDGIVTAIPGSPRDAEGYYQAGLAAASHRDWPVAIAAFGAAQNRAHLNPRYMYNLGLAYARAGQEIPAIAWLVAYLVAAPATPDRDQIWRQIHTLEQSANERVERLWARLDAAVAVYYAPANRDMSQGFLVRYLALVAARGGDLPRMDRLARQARSADSGGDNYYMFHTLDNEIQFYRLTAIEAAADDGDIPGFEALRRQFSLRGNFPTGYPGPDAWIPAFERSLFGAKYWGAAWTICDINPCTSGQSGEIMRIRREALARSDQGDDEAALDLLSSGLMRYLGMDPLYDGDNLHVHRWTALPVSDWVEFQHDPPALIAQHNLEQGRFDRALTMAERAGSFRYTRFLEFVEHSISAGSLQPTRPAAEIVSLRERAVQASGGGQVYSPDQRLRVEAAITIATSLPGAAYDLPRWLDVTDRAASPAERVTESARAAAALPSALRRIRALYERSGGPWGR